MVELDEDKFWLSYIVGTAGEGKAEGLLYVPADEAPPSNAVNSSKRSMSVRRESWEFAAKVGAVNVPCIAMFGVCGMLPVDCENSGTGGRVGRCCCNEVEDEGADEA